MFLTNVASNPQVSQSTAISLNDSNNNLLMLGNTTSSSNINSLSSNAVWDNNYFTTVYNNTAMVSSLFPNVTDTYNNNLNNTHDDSLSKSPYSMNNDLLSVITVEEENLSKPPLNLNEILEKSNDNKIIMSEIVAKGQDPENNIIKTEQDPQGTSNDIINKSTSQLIQNKPLQKQVKETIAKQGIPSESIEQTLHDFKNRTNQRDSLYEYLGKLIAPVIGGLTMLIGGIANNISSIVPYIMAAGSVKYAIKPIIAFIAIAACIKFGIAAIIPCIALAAYAKYYTPHKWQDVINQPHSSNPLSK